MQNNKGQMFIFNMMILVMSILVMTTFLPVLKTTLDNARHQDSLNCKGNINVCSVNSASPCYNNSIRSDITACLALDLYLPYIVLVILIGGVSYLLMGRGQQPQMQGGF